MASSSSSPSAPAFTSRSWKYDVFLSFRGEDTRNTFVGHLYSALEQKGIYTYKDDETLPRGESIGPTLMNAIEESQIAVIIFSKNYGDSSWCLDELSHIMKCRDTIGLIVMPIFYDVDPSEVRKQKREYGEAFDKHELENKTKVESWRKALEDASNISGWEPKHIANGDESKGIKQIIGEISKNLQKLQPLTSSASENLIGMEARLRGLRSKLQLGLDGVRMLGIWGVGGGGKTTLALSIYDEIYKQFDGCCFVENIREESVRYGLGTLQEKIISKIEAGGAGGGGELINSRFRRRKVLIVLDDIDHLDQLEALTGSHNWFGNGSRIIITTRDEQLLIAHKVDVIHNIILLTKAEALKVFCKIAPQKNIRLEDYEQLSEEVVTYAGGLPLALKVLGSFLCGKDIHQWKSALARLREIPNDDIVGKLKISFDGLTMVEKELFLDIACFFRGRHKAEAMKILDDCDFHPAIGVKVLIQKALITISEDEVFDMHDLIQEMGHYIVREKYPNRPETNSRVWGKDIEEICAMDATTNFDKIEAIYLKYYAYRLPEHLPPIVANSKNLRLIKWEGDLSSPLLTNFPPRTLCCLILRSSLQKQLWEGYKLLPNLKTIRLVYLENLIMTPNFEGLPNLEEFSLQSCWSLKEIHPSIVHLTKLVLLCIEDCWHLKMIPRILKLEDLKTLSFACCHQVSEDHSSPHNQQSSWMGLFLKNLKDLNLCRWCLRDEESSPNFSVGCSNVPGVEHYLEDHSSPHNQQSSWMGLFLKNLKDLNLCRWCLRDEESSPNFSVGCSNVPGVEHYLEDHSSPHNQQSSWMGLFLKNLKDLNLCRWCLRDEESSPNFSVGCSNVPGVEHYLEDHSSPHNQQSSWMGLFLKNLKDLNLCRWCLRDEESSPNFSVGCSNVPGVEHYLEDHSSPHNQQSSWMGLFLKNLKDLNLCRWCLRDEESSPNFSVGCSNVPGVEHYLEDHSSPHNQQSSWMGLFLKNLKDLNLCRWCLRDEESSPNFSVGCSNVPGVEHYLEDHSSPHNQQSSWMGLFLNNLRDLNLSECCLRDEEIGSAVWDLPNLIKLNLSHNEFSRLNFSRLRLPQLKWLKVSGCKKLVKLSELPSSIAVVYADWCKLLESFGDISNCKWLWYVSLEGKNKLGPDVGDILLDSMLQGNASQDYFISFTFKHQIPKSFVGRLFRRKAITLHLLDDWYNRFWGFSICFVADQEGCPYVDIVVKQEVDKDSLFGVWRESNEAAKPEHDETKTSVGYFSFDSLRHTAFSNSSDTMISVSLRYYWGYIGARLIPRKSEGDQPQTTKVAADSSEFWDEELGDRPQTFKIIHDSKSSIKIEWKPWDHDM